MLEELLLIDFLNFRAFSVGPVLFLLTFRWVQRLWLESWLFLIIATSIDCVNKKNKGRWISCRYYNFFSSKCHPWLCQPFLWPLSLCPALMEQRQTALAKVKKNFSLDFSIFFPQLTMEPGNNFNFLWWFSFTSCNIYLIWCIYIYNLMLQTPVIRWKFHGQGTHWNHAKTTSWEFFSSWFYTFT